MNEIKVINQGIAVIEWDKETALKEAQEIMAKYKGLEFTEEQLPEAKNEIATLRKVSKEINSQALEIDKELTAPVKEFRNEVKEVKAIVDKGIEYINEQVQIFENKLKQERKLEITALEEYQAIKDYIGFDDKWLLKKFDNKTLIELFNGARETIQSSINTIKLMATQNDLQSEKYTDMFKSQSLEQVAQRIAEDFELLHKKAPVVVDIDESTHIIVVTRTLTGTVPQLKELKRYALSIGVKWNK